MKHRYPQHASARAGMSLIEMMVSASLLGLVGLIVAWAFEAGVDSQRTVRRIAAGNEVLRVAAGQLRDELRVSEESMLTVNTLGDGNHEVTLAQPIFVGGNLGWGVYDPLAGATEAERNLDGWRIRYTVDTQPVVPAGVTRRLVRQVLDDLGTVQDQDVLVDGLRAGGDDPPGFTVVRTGDVWEVSLTTEEYDDSQRGRGVRFHVRIRN